MSVPSLRQEKEEFSHALDFDGSDDYVDLGGDLDKADFGDSEGQITIAAWVKPDVVNKYNAITGYVGGVRYFSAGSTSSSGKLYCMVYNATAAGNHWPTSSGTISASVWTHVAFVFDAANDQYEFFLNGVSDGLQTETDDLELKDYSTGTKYLGNGDFSADGKTSHFDGLLDNVLVYNRALSDEEIEALYEAGNTHGSELPMAHDANGNLTRNREGVTMEYDAFNRLKEVTNVDGETVAAYVYDADNRRMQKVVTNGGLPEDSMLNGTTRYYYHGWRVLEEYIFVDTSETLERQFTYGNYLDEVWTIDDRDGVTIANLNNGSGSDRHFAHNNTLYHVYGLTDETGALVEGCQYDAYGKATIFTDGDDGDSIVNFNSNDDTADWSSVNNPYQYTGQRYDPETGWMYYKHRYYDTAQGRFISRDPVKYRNGMNLYIYVASRPMKFLDPHGLTSHVNPLFPPYNPLTLPLPHEDPILPHFEDPILPHFDPPFDPFARPYDPFDDPGVPQSIRYARDEGCPPTSGAAKRDSRWCADTTVMGVYSGKKGKDCFRSVPLGVPLGSFGKQCCYNKDGSFVYPSHDENNPVEERNPDGTCNFHTWYMSKHLAKDWLPYKCGQIKKKIDKELEKRLPKWPYSPPTIPLPIRVR